MAKLLNMLLLIFAIECGMVLFVGSDFVGSTLWEWISTGNSGNFSDYIDEMLALGGATAILIGTIWTKSDFLIFAGISSVFFSFITSIFQLWKYIDGMGLFAGHGGSVGIAMLFVSPFIIMYVYVILNFWRGRD